MRDIKSVVYNFEYGKCVLKTLREDDNGKQFVATDVIPLRPWQKFLFGQEVEIKHEVLPGQGDYPMPVVYKKGPVEKGDQNDQGKRLNNLKQIMEISLLTDTCKQLEAEFVKAGGKNFYVDFGLRYRTRITQYQSAAMEIIKESYPKDNEGNCDPTDEEFDMEYDLTSSFSESLAEGVDVVSQFPPDLMIKSIKDYNARTNFVQKFFDSANDLVKMSHDLHDENKNNITL